MACCRKSTLTTFPLGVHQSHFQKEEKSKSIPWQLISGRKTGGHEWWGFCRNRGKFRKTAPVDGQEQPMKETRHTTEGNHSGGTLLKHVNCVEIYSRKHAILWGHESPRNVTYPDWLFLSFTVGKRCSVLGWHVVLLSGCVLHDVIATWLCVHAQCSAWHTCGFGCSHLSQVTSVQSSASKVLLEIWQRPTLTACQISNVFNCYVFVLYTTALRYAYNPC